MNTIGGVTFLNGFQFRHCIGPPPHPIGGRRDAIFSQRNTPAHEHNQPVSKFQMPHQANVANAFDAKSSVGGAHTANFITKYPCPLQKVRRFARRLAIEL